MGRNWVLWSVVTLCGSLWAQPAMVKVCVVGVESASAQELARELNGRLAVTGKRIEAQAVSQSQQAQRSGCEFLVEATVREPSALAESGVANSALPEPSPQKSAAEPLIWTLRRPGEAHVIAHGIAAPQRVEERRVTPYRAAAKAIAAKLSR